jgi:hypothetical protein
MHNKDSRTRRTAAAGADIDQDVAKSSRKSMLGE